MKYRMPMASNAILHIALPVPVRHHFDYLVGADQPAIEVRPGMRVLVPFGRSKQSVGIVIGVSDTSEIATHRLKPVAAILDDAPLFDHAHLNLLRWASDYYHYPLGELIFSTLPGPLRLGKKAVAADIVVWQVNTSGLLDDSVLSSRSHKQRYLYDLLRLHPDGLGAEQLNNLVDAWRGPLKILIEKGLVCRVVSTPTHATGDPLQHVTLNDQQLRAFEIISSSLGMNRRILLDGITGSGKTEVYLETIRQVIDQGKQAVILVPEIGLTPQLISRFRQRIHANMVVMHSGLSDGERLAAWLQARNGTARIVLGTRSAIWTPLREPGIFIIDEEHDASYKQQDGFRYSARDIAILRANNENIPVLLGSATPSLESLHNVNLGRIERVILSRRAENAVLPVFRIVDIRGQKISGALSDSLLTAIGKVLAEKKQVLLYLNRRGYSPVLMCHECGWIGKCERCDVPYTAHKLKNSLICHHCGTQQRLPGNCPACKDSELVHIGFGTERLTEVLREKFPQARILRIDRDSTRRKGSMEQYLASIRTGETDILVGTQMLAKGHHLPGIILVGIIDADRGLYSADFRASERMAQNIIQVSGRAGRANDPGTVMIQTHFPEHPFLSALVKGDYHTFTQMLLDERKSTNLPPYSCLALLRAEAYEQKLPMAFLKSASLLFQHDNNAIQIYGPFPAPVEKRSGRYRFQLLVQSDNRSTLQKSLQPWVKQLEEMKESKKIRWSLDVDPLEML
jgi:primosomal protein N' (replication factor Y) (superfamily II helicase)